MARFLALDWDHAQLHLVAATTKGQTIQTQRALTVKEDRTPNLATAEALGQSLRQVLQAEKITAASVLVSIGRDRIVLKEVLYPQVPAREEPAIVRFQALKELTHSPEEVIIDYYPTPDPGPNGERRALVLILRREMLQTYQTLCKAAGLKLAGITPRPFGMASCVQRAAGAGVPLVEGAAAVLTVTETWAEFGVVSNGTLLFARSLAAAAPGSENGLLGEIRRNLAIYAGQTPQHPVRALYLAESGDRSALRELLQNTLAVPVHALDPFGGAVLPGVPNPPRGSFAGLVGLLQAQAGKDGLPINFLAPKEPKPERDPNKWRLVAAAAAIGFLLLAGAGWGYSRMVQLDHQIKFLNQEKISVEGLLEQMEVDAKRIKAVGDWVDNEIVWLDELYDLTERFPSIENMRLIRFNGALPNITATSNAKAKGNLKPPGKVTLEVITPDDRQYIQALERGLVVEKYYRVEPPVPSRNSGVERNRFRAQHTTKIDITARPPTDYKLRLRAKPPQQQEDDEEDEGVNPPARGNRGGRQ